MALTESKESQNGRVPLTYHVDMNMDWFRDVYKQQNMAYYRKIGIMCLVFFIPLTLISLFFVIQDPASAGTEGFGAVVLFAALAVLGGALASGKGIMMKTRKGEISGFFAQHGMPEPKGSYTIDDLHCSYDVTVEEPGFAEAVTLENGLKMVEKRPWVTLTGKGGDAAGGYTFAANDGKNSSLWYNMLGINALLREGLEVSPLVVPKQVERENPWLVAWIAGAIERQKAELKGSAKKQARQALSDWAATEAYLPDGRKVDPDNADDMAEVNRLLGE